MIELRRILLCRLKIMFFELGPVFQTYWTFHEWKVQFIQLKKNHNVFWLRIFSHWNFHETHEYFMVFKLNFVCSVNWEHLHILQFSNSHLKYIDEIFIYSRKTSLWISTWNRRLKCGWCWYKEQFCFHSMCFDFPVNMFSTDNEVLFMLVELYNINL